MSIDYHSLTDLEKKVMDGVIAGLTAKEIAIQLGISKKAVNYRVEKLIDLSGARNRVQLAQFIAASKVNQ